MTSQNLSQVVEQKYVDLLMENAPLCFLVLDKAKNVVYANDYMKSFLKADQGDPVGQKCYALCGYKSPCLDCVLDECMRDMTEKELSRSEVQRFNSIRFSDIVDVPLPASENNLDEKQDLFMEIIFDRTQEIILERKLEYDFDSTVDTLAFILSVQESAVASANESIARLAVSLGERMGLTYLQLRELRAAALLHNLGKISIYKLRETEGTTAEESSRNYAELSADTLKSIDRMKGIANIIRCHLANYDGSGDPQEISGDTLPLESSILRLAIMILDFFPGAVDIDKLSDDDVKLLGQLFSVRSGNIFAPAVIAGFKKAIGFKE